MKEDPSAQYQHYSYEYTSLRTNDLYGVKRVALFCLLTAILPTVLIILPLYLRHVIYADVVYTVSASDVLEIHEGLSTVFCQSHSLKMNKTFNAFQVNKKSIVTNSRKHIRLKKSMILPDDTLEYWGFYLLKGAIVELKVCSRFEGSNLLVTRGEKTLNTCGLLNDHLDKIDTVLAQGHEKVSVTFQSEKSAVENDDVSEQRDNFTDSGDNNVSEQLNDRFKRDIEDPQMQLHNPNHILDRGVNHGGNAVNYSEKASNETAGSSFENGLLECYDGNILLNQEFPASISCTNISYLEIPPQSKMTATHEVISDGYYYYIFYSDNDVTYNNIYAIFDISKPTFQYANMSKTKSCVSKTECNFAISFFSREVVIVEIPTLDGIEKNDYDNISLLTSTCNPRVSVYIFFPVAIILVILGFAFL